MSSSAPHAGASTARQVELVELVALLACRLAATLGVLWSGFRAVSDDDYARIVIAERLVAEPKLDPSGTSWLPFPFWVMGGAMAAFGRSIDVARGAAIALGLVSGLCLHLALIRWRVPRRERVVGLAVVFLLPWTLWTTATTVPEACTAGFASAAVLFATLPTRDASAGTTLASGSLVCAATLSRYEAWPVAVVVAALLVARAARSPERRGAELAAAAIALAGPAGWMFWNQLAHGSPTHFLFRVARFKRALGGPEPSAVERVLAYPKLLVTFLPETVAFGGLLVLSRAGRLAPARRGVLGASLAILAFLVYGNLQDGAPTHHAERALLPIAFLLAPVGVAELGEAGWSSLKGRLAMALAVPAALLAFARLVDPPGTGQASRAAQVARGEALRSEGARSLSVTPCAYEHFALVAAYGAPERVTITPPAPSPGPCPDVRLSP